MKVERRSSNSFVYVCLPARHFCPIISRRLPSCLEIASRGESTSSCLLSVRRLTTTCLPNWSNWPFGPSGSRPLLKLFEDRISSWMSLLSPDACRRRFVSYSAFIRALHFLSPHHQMRHTDSQLLSFDSGCAAGLTSLVHPPCRSY